MPLVSMPWPRVNWRRNEPALRSRAIHFTPSWERGVRSARMLSSCPSTSMSTEPGSMPGRSALST